MNELTALKFERLTIFQPSFIQTPVNRYGFSQAVVLRVRPDIKPILPGRLLKYSDIPVELLGKAMAVNTLNNKKGLKILHLERFYDLI